jgi:hypothetical protein
MLEGRRATFRLNAIKTRKRLRRAKLMATKPQFCGYPMAATEKTKVILFMASQIEKSDIPVATRMKTIRYFRFFIQQHRSSLLRFFSSGGHRLALRLYCFYVFVYSAAATRNSWKKKFIPKKAEGRRETESLIQRQLIVLDTRKHLCE